MRPSLSIWYTLACIWPSSFALFEEDVGKFDFLITTTGHGPVTSALSSGDTVITASDSSCYVASRSILTGDVLWRRNVCFDSTSSGGSKVALIGKYVATLDDVGTLRGWSLEDGTLLWDQKLDGNNDNNDLFGFHMAGTDIIAVDGRNLNASTGVDVESVSRKDAEIAKQNKDDQTEIFCAATNLKIKLDANRVVAVREDTEVSSVKLEVEKLTELICDSSRVIVLVTSSQGTTAQVTFSGDSAEIGWVTEEGLANISAALMLDASHENVKEGQEASMLEFSSRLQSQWNSLSKIFTPDRAHRDHLFGFVKIAVLLSKFKVFGVETAGPDRGKVRYQVPLPENSNWHRMVHGSKNAVKGAHGINGGAHTRDVLILSSLGDKIVWNCIDGTSGRKEESGSVDISSPVLQIIPLPGIGQCRQGALLLLEDMSMVSVNEASSSVDAVGMYTHALDKKNGGLFSYGITKSSDDTLESHLVGSAHFPGEEIIVVAYPPREEVVQSPCSILGDDSLLLKYLNPHLVVVLSMSTGEGEDSGGVSFSLKPKSAAKSKKRKPLGVTQPGQEVASKQEEKPNLFVTLIDSVSGRVIYRASHANAASNPHPSVLVSENWVFYTFTNAKTKKAELGVLSLYEGMIEKKGLSAFTSPEQSTSFSSLDARENKAVVLAKTFTIPQAATALGMTSTRSGISGRRLIIAGLDGQVYTVERRVLEPRRPLGQLKEAEKKEGLVQYHELVPKVPYLTLSYNRTVESVRSIVSVPTDLESQTLILAYGGPDIFFTRTSPSRGFDLLPDSFNKVALMLVLAAVITALVVMQRLVSKKILKQGWV